MISTLLLATLAAAPARAPASPPEPPHATEEAALVQAAYPDQDLKTGFLGHGEGYLIGRSSACADGGACYLAVAASDTVPGAEGGHAWSTFFAFKFSGGSWVEVGHAAGPVTNATGRWQIGVSARIDRDGPFFTVTTSASSPEEGEVSATHLWSWSGKRFLQVLTATTARQGATEIEASFVSCADRPEDHPSWELRSREREGRGKWTETRSRVLWNGQAWVERPADKACSERSSPISPPPVAAAAGAGAGTAAPAAAPPPKFRSASASKTAAPPKGAPRATAAANAIDGNRQTAWMAGGKKGGVGEWLQLDLAAPSAIGSLQLVTACPGADWKASPRVKKVRIRYPDGPAQEESLADVTSPQSLTLKRKEPAGWIRLELVELYKGSKWQDACIAEAVPQAR
jgi:hypothetical protein